MTSPRVHLGGVVLAAASLLATGLVSPGWVFGKYPALAESFARGGVTAAQVSDASPGYLLLHLLSTPLLVRWLQAGLAALTVVMLFQLLRRQAGPLAAWLGAGALAASQHWLIYSAVMEPDLLIGVALASTIVILEGPSSLRRLVLAGLALGVAVSLRPTALLFGVLVIGWLLVRKTGLRGVAAFACAALIAGATPSLILRAKAGHDLRGTMSAGQVFHLSHRPESVGFGASFPSLVKIVEAQAMASGPHPPDFAHELYRELAGATEVADAEAFWFARALAFFRLEPRAAFGQLLHKALFFTVPPADEYDIPAVQPLIRRAYGLPLRWLTLLGLGGLAVLLATRSAVGRPWMLAWAASLLVAVIFYFHGRYAVGLVPSLAALLGLGLAAAWKERRRRWLGLVLAAPLLFLALPVVRWSDRMVERLNMIDAERSHQSTRESYIEEQAALSDTFWPTSPHGVGLGPDDPELARLAAVRAVARYGTDSPVDATLAAALWAAADRCDTALQLADGAAASGFIWAIGDKSIDPRLVASDCLVRLGRREEALARLEASHREHPGRLDTLARLIAAGDVGMATDVKRWDQELEVLHDPATARFALTSARRHWGDPQGALVDADWLKLHWPRAAPFAEHERSLCLLELNQPGAAIDALAQALQIRAGLHEQSRLNPLVTALTEGAPDNPKAAALAEVHWRRQGKHSQ